ncbi:MAG: serine hydrolase domain-containing protein [Bacteroidota bacterium]
MKYLLLGGMMWVCSIAFAQPTPEPLTNALDSLISDASIVGGAAAIVKEGKVIYQHGFGWANEAEQVAYTTQTRQPIASISKTLIAISLMKAQEMDLLALDDPINQYLPFPISHPGFPAQAITVRQLANHTAGLKDSKYYQKSYVFQRPIPELHRSFSPGIKRAFIKRAIKRYNRNEEIPQAEFLKRIYHPEGVWYHPKHFLKQAPGTTYEYSNNGAALASLVIEQVSGLSYPDFVKQYLLNPLGMEHSGWEVDEKGYADGSFSRQYPFGLAVPPFRLITLADGGFVTHLEDMNRYLIAMMAGDDGQGPLLQAESYQEMFTASAGSSIGVFWDTNSLGQENFLGHTGGDPGVTTILCWDRERELGYLLLTNTSDTKTLNEEIGQFVRLLVQHSRQWFPDEQE